MEKTIMKPDDYKNSLSQFASGVTAITWRDRQLDTFNGMTVSSFSSLSMEPTLICFNVSSKAKSISVFQLESEFVVNILSTEQQPISGLLANPDENRDKAIRDQGFHLIQNSPGLDNSLAWIHCRTHQIVKAGDHHIIIGLALDCKTDESKQPLLYYNRAYRQLKALDC